MIKPTSQEQRDVAPDVCEYGPGNTRLPTDGLVVGVRKFVFVLYANAADMTEENREAK
jgi:hypothetical protein